MACGRPVIVCTDAGSDLERLVKETQAGAVVPPGDAQALSDAILNAFRNREIWRQQGLNARDVVLRHYSRRAVGERYHNLVMELTERQRVTPDEGADEK
jgi:glycosyltransferase involved in cell wall biosynthesis